MLLLKARQERKDKMENIKQILEVSTKENHYRNICLSYLYYGETHATKYLHIFEGNDTINSNDINYILLKKYILSYNEKNSKTLDQIIPLYLTEGLFNNLNNIINTVPKVKILLIQNYIENINKTDTDLLWEQSDQLQTKTVKYLKCIYNFYDDATYKHDYQKIKQF